MVATKSKKYNDIASKNSNSVICSLLTKTKHRNWYFVAWKPFQRNKVEIEGLFEEKVGAKQKKVGKVAPTFIKTVCTNT